MNKKTLGIATIALGGTGELVTIIRQVLLSINDASIGHFDALMTWIGVPAFAGIIVAGVLFLLGKKIAKTTVKLLLAVGAVLFILYAIRLYQAGEIIEYVGGFSDALAG